MKPLSIGELARRTGVRASAIRYYEDVGVLPKPARSSGRRRYDAEALRLIEVLKFARQTGFTLEEIRTLFQGFRSGSQLNARWQVLARKKIEELDAQLRRIRNMRRTLELGLKCGCIRIEDCAVSSPDHPPESVPGTDESH